MALGIRFKRTMLPRLDASGLFECVDRDMSPLAFSSGHPAFATKRLQCRDGGPEERDQLWRDLGGDAPSHRSTPVKIGNAAASHPEGEETNWPGCERQKLERPAPALDRDDLDARHPGARPFPHRGRCADVASRLGLPRNKPDRVAGSERYPRM